jgi:dolichyl-phosphate beta-glucosyltransferase
MALACPHSVIVGYADADFATPPKELKRLAELIRSARLDVLIGARVALAGRDIKRKRSRHYAGRVFATFASIALNRSIYDTQCGAKFFRVNDELVDALAECFESPWLFDIELLGRLFVGSKRSRGLRSERFLEEPLLQWEDVAGSKVDLFDFLRAPFDLAAIWVRLQMRPSKNVAPRAFDGK